MKTINRDFLSIICLVLLETQTNGKMRIHLQRHRHIFHHFLGLKLRYTYMIVFQQLDIHIVHKSISECDTMNVHIDDTTYVSYYDVFQNLMFPSSRKSKGNLSKNMSAKYKCLKFEMQLNKISFLQVNLQIFQNIHQNQREINE